MRSSADDIPVIRTSADDEPVPAPQPEPPPPPAPPPPRKTVSKKRPTAPVLMPEEERSADEIPWQVTPESVAAIPPEIAAPAPPAPRRTPTQTFRLLEQEPEKKPAPRPRRRRRPGYWRKRFVLLLVLVGVGAGAYWYVKIRNPAEPLPWAGLLDRAKRLVARARAPSPAARRPAPRGTQSGNTQPAPAAAPLAPPQPPSPFARFDRLSDSLSRAVRNFQDRASLFAGGRMDCGGLSSGLATIENLWITYNTERRARMAAFDPRRAAQDQALYAAVDSVESRFEQSGCTRRGA